MFVAFGDCLGSLVRSPNALYLSRLGDGCWIDRHENIVPLTSIPLTFLNTKRYLQIHTQPALVAFLEFETMTVAIQVAETATRVR